MKNSAVEFIVQRLAENGILHSSDICEAKEIEKQRIISAWNSAYGGDSNYTAEQYYNEIFKAE